jgi:hypothetical protein
VKNKIILLVDDGFFGQSYNTWKSIDVEKVQNSFCDSNFEVDILSISDVNNADLLISDSYVVYSGSVLPEVGDYIKDALRYLDKNNVLIPSYDHCMCLENKGFQEIFKKVNDVHTLKANYYSSLKEVDFKAISYPLVMKRVDGAGSKYVELIKSKFELVWSYIKMKGILHFALYELLLIRKFFLVNTSDYQEYKRYHFPRMRFVLQEFVEGLAYDYKALVFGEKIFLLKRSIRKDDFRASGSGKFEFVSEVSDGLLEYIYSTYKSFNCPCVSLDIVECKDNFGLIEFQFLHFGPYTLQKSDGYFVKHDGVWKYNQSPESILEEEFSSSYLSYILEHFEA